MALIPLPALAAVLLMVAYPMSGWRAFRAELTAPRSDLPVMLTTFGLTVLVDLKVAIQVGMVLAAFLFMRRMAEISKVTAVTREFAEPAEDEPAGTERRVGGSRAIRSATDHPRRATCVAGAWCRAAPGRDPHRIPAAAAAGMRCGSRRRPMPPVTPPRFRELDRSEIDELLGHAAGPASTPNGGGG